MDDVAQQVGVLQTGAHGGCGHGDQAGLGEVGQQYADDRERQVRVGGDLRDGRGARRTSSSSELRAWSSRDSVPSATVAEILDIRSNECSAAGRVRPRVTVYGRTMGPVSSSYQVSLTAARPEVCVVG